MLSALPRFQFPFLSLAAELTLALRPPRLAGAQLAASQAIARAAQLESQVHTLQQEAERVQVRAEYGAMAAVPNALVIAGAGSLPFLAFKDP